jgi:hypothetical protein
VHTGQQAIKSSFKQQSNLAAYLKGKQLIFNNITSSAELNNGLSGNSTPNLNRYQLSILAV